MEAFRSLILAVSTEASITILYDSPAAGSSGAREMFVIVAERGIHCDQEPSNKGLRSYKDLRHLLIMSVTGSVPEVVVPILCHVVSQIASQE